MPASPHGPGTLATGDRGPLHGRLPGPMQLWLSVVTSRYVVALVVSAAAAAAWSALRHVRPLQSMLVPWLPAVVAAASYGGIGPGLLVTAVSAITGAYLLPPPDGDPSGWPGLATAVFVSTGVAVTWLVHQWHDARAAARTASMALTGLTTALDTIRDTTLDGIIVVDARGIIEAFNRGAQAMFGYQPADVLGRHVSLLLPAADDGAADTFVERHLATDGAPDVGIGRQMTARRHDGSPLPIHLAIGEMDLHGARKFTVLLHDLTKRADLAHQLHASESRARAIVETASDAIIVIDSTGRIETFNPAAERLFGYAPDEVLGQNVSLLMPSPHREAHHTYISRFLETGTPHVIGTGRQVDGRRKDGTTFPLRLSVAEIALDGERRFAGILHDLSDRIRMEQQLREREALAQLGEMAAVIAHEVTNPLAAIRGAIQVLGGRMSQDGAAVDIVNEIIRRLDGLDRMMKDLLLCARPPQPARVAVDVLALAKSTAALLTEDPALRQVDVHLDGESARVYADPHMLTVALQNLLINGAQAMQGTGRIAVGVHVQDATVQITVHDDGPGIPADLRRRIFVPFFTTKAHGSGLGLPTVKRFVEAHDGEIAIDCPPTGGTTVLIRLPTTSASPAPLGA